MKPEISHPQMDFNFPPELSQLENIDSNEAQLADELRGFWLKRISTEDLQKIQWLLGFKPNAYIDGPNRLNELFLSKFELMHLKDSEVQALYLAIKSSRKLSAVPNNMLEISGEGAQGKPEFYYSFPPVSLEVMEGIANEIENTPRRDPRDTHAPRATNLRAAIARVKSSARPV